ncbi:MAG: hypothetical protein HWE26_13535 [Alteromonadaceae bacterium]|nr:hypothetical protein [Alteromonadaceae bacterium]
MSNTISMQDMSRKELQSLAHEFAKEAVLSIRERDLEDARKDPEIDVMSDSVYEKQIDDIAKCYFEGWMENLRNGS